VAQSTNTAKPLLYTVCRTCRTRNRKTVRKEMIWKRDKFWGGFEKQTALKLRWRWAADCSRGGIRQPEMHDRQQWTAVYVGSLAARMTTTWDGDGRVYSVIPVVRLCRAFSPLYRASRFPWLDNQQLDVSTSYLEILFMTRGLAWHNDDVIETKLYKVSKKIASCRYTWEIRIQEENWKLSYFGNLTRTLYCSFRLSSPSWS